MTVKCRDGHAKSADVTLATFCYGLAFFRWKQMPRSQCEMATNLLPCSSGCIRGYKDQPLFFFFFFACLPFWPTKQKMSRYHTSWGR